MTAKHRHSFRALHNTHQDSKAVMVMAKPHAAVWQHEAYCGPNPVLRRYYYLDRQARQQPCGAGLHAYQG